MITPLKLKRASLPDTGRIIAISDVHANLPYLKGLIEKLALRPEDTLVFVGDTMEKGPQSLDTLRFLMQLDRERRCLFVLGNCDYWYDDENPSLPCTDWYVRDYLLSNAMGNGPGLLAQMCERVGFELRPDFDMDEFRERLGAAFAPEFEFLARMPQLIETEHYVFVHGGIPTGSPRSWDGWHLMKNDNFLNQGRKFKKWVIVGHWPVMLYRESITDAKPLIDRESRIISIDGGCVLKDDGQLNALIIPHNGSEDFSCTWYDPFPVRRAASAQKGSERSAYIRWGDNEVEILERGEEFSRVRHLRTGYELDILTKYLYGESGVVKCNDCTDYVLPLSPGDEISIVETTSRGYLCKHNGVSGWYYGELE